MTAPPGFAGRYGPRAVVTGASSGIGEEYARQLAAAGLDLVVAARRVDRLTALADELAAAHGRDVRVVQADLGTDEGVATLRDATAGLDVGLAVLNAGFGDKGPVVDSELDRLLAMVQLNCVSTTALAHHYATRLRERGRGGLILTSSTAAFQGIPLTAVYAATKGFDLQLAEGLWGELRPHGVDVCALCPGATDTEGPRRTGVDPTQVPHMKVGPVVEAALHGLGRRPVVIPGTLNTVAAFANRLVPRSVATRVAGNLIRKATGG